MSILYFNYVKNKKQALNYAIQALCLFEDQQKFLLICYISLNKRGSSCSRSLRRSVLHVLMSCVHAQCEKHACQDRKSLMPLHIYNPKYLSSRPLNAFPCLASSQAFAGLRPAAAYTWQYNLNIAYVYLYVFFAAHPNQYHKP